ncbi:hypothetical protein EDB85DRAFT_2175120 [Lactarius pseudohatsudake]|nr:hypothetical protein EDB85DRAFT_2175120 [Lactarius pseudohatsudake]
MTKLHGAGLAPSSSDSDAGAFAWFLFGVRLPFPSFTAPTTLKTPNRVYLVRALCIVVVVMMVEATTCPGRETGPHARFPTRHLVTRADDDGYSSAVTKRVVVDREPCLLPSVKQMTDGFVHEPEDSPARRDPYVDHPAIRFYTRESVEMPFRYMIALGPIKKTSHFFHRA